MKLRLKLVIYNALSKALIVLAFGALLPIVSETVVYNHIDQRLKARTEKILTVIYRGGLDEIALEQDCSFENFDILKEEFVTIGPLDNTDAHSQDPVFENRDWTHDNDALSHRVLIRNFQYDNQWYELHVGEGNNTVEGLNSVFVRFTIIIMILVTLLSVLSDIGFVQILLKPFYKIVNTKLRGSHDPTSFNFDRIESSTYEFNHLDKSINELMQKVKETIMIEKEFIANVSHELLTPISILNNRLENIVVSAETDDDVSRKIVASQKTLNRLNKIIKALLMISKIENEQFLKEDSFKLDSLIEEVLLEIEDRVSQKNLKLIKEFNTNIELSKYNKSLMFTMFFNLINNAIKYNIEDGIITISIDKNTVHIKDTGVGISKEQLPSIFNRFERLQHADEGSYGLGLPIVKKIADFHNIKISVESAVNKGTDFKLVFPEEKSLAK
ncbi:MAG: HAMP domain-containing histidine kinase [Bacteroidia bacterium]|nr:HAMP domain-containing histidine kinase [Bacteroidia bacterium]